MGYELNSDAYKLLTQIEVGVREFLIDLIKCRGVQNWAQTFLGNIHLDSLKVIAKRIHEAEQKQEDPQIEDIYLSKLQRAVKSEKEAFKAAKVYHPFYYLNWTDMDALMSKHTELINDHIGKPNRELIVANLRVLNFLRNDIAHSRFISEQEFNCLQSAFQQISSLVPNFEEHYNYQTTEDKYEVLIANLEAYIVQMQSSDMLDLFTVDAILDHLETCLSSFWLNSIRLDIATILLTLKEKVVEYKKYRTCPGGLLYIQTWKRNNSEFLQEIKTRILDRKV